MIGRYFFLVLILPFLTSCIVSKKKYDDVNSRKSILEVEKADLEDSVSVLSSDNETLSKNIEAFRDQVESLSLDTTELSKLYKELISEYGSLSAVSEADAKNLSNQLEKVGKLRMELEKRDFMLEKDAEEIDSLQGNLEEREAKVAELENVLKERDAAVLDLKKRISSTLLGFQNGELSVDVRDGKVYVSLSEQLLFKSGSYSVDSKGKKALAQLASALKDNKDIDVVVEGHTDDVPLKGKGTIKDNWDLSVLRATSIVKLLVDSGLDPKMVSASGRGEHKPKEEGKTPEVRKINRRTEIIISPDLSELFNLMEN